MADDPIPALVYRLNQNILALGSAVEEIGEWIDQRGSTHTSAKITEHLVIIEENSLFIREAVGVLISQWKPDTPPPKED
jgi:hypothetical protein